MNVEARRRKLPSLRINFEAQNDFAYKTEFIGKSLSLITKAVLLSIYFGGLFLARSLTA
jgi:hypothetical protein